MPICFETVPLNSCAIRAMKLFLEISCNMSKVQGRTWPPLVSSKRKPYFEAELILGDIVPLTFFYICETVPFIW
jgi:hypothetical protein